VGALQADAGAPIMHLRGMNPYVTAALEDWRKSARLQPRIPLQPSGGNFGLSQAAGGGGGSDGGRAVGTSSFGMSGVNAHALLSRASGEHHSTGAEPSQARRSQHHIAEADVGFELEWPVSPAIDKRQCWQG